MKKEEIIEKIREILVSVVKHENFKISDGLTASDVDGWDSLTHMIIITEIEKKFSIKFKLKDLNKLSNIGSLVEIIQSKLLPQ